MILFATSFHAANAQNDAIGRFFKQYENNEAFTLISISPKMFKMMSKIDWKDVQPPVKKAISQLTGFRMLTTEKEAIKYYTEAVSKLNLNRYDEIMTMRDGDENVRFFTKGPDPVIEELVMLVGSKTDFVLMSLTGIIDLDNISQLGSMLNINGMGNIKSVKSKK